MQKGTFAPAPNMPDIVWYIGTVTEFKMLCYFCAQDSKTCTIIPYVV